MELIANENLAITGHILQQESRYEEFQ